MWTFTKIENMLVSYHFSKAINEEIQGSLEAQLLDKLYKLLFKIK